jgi:hypothetical protein
MIQRNTPLRRSSRLKSRSSKAQTVARLYSRDAARYLEQHPFCQIWLARNEADEEMILTAYRSSGSPSSWEFRGTRIPRSTEIHHRNKRDGARLRDQRWWLAACREQHEWVEMNKSDARALGYLLPIQATTNGTWGDGNQGIETPAFMKAKARRV